MENVKRKRNYRRAVTWVASLSSIIAAGLGLLNKASPKSRHMCQCSHHDGAFGPGAAPTQTLAPQPDGANALGAGLSFPIFPPSGDGFLPDSFINSLPYNQLYHGTNQARYCEQPIFVKDYFRNLTNQFPTNDDEQNCSYVGLSMLLSYYDTYWNSSLVDEEYEVPGQTHLDSLSDTDFESPGVKDLNLLVWGYLPNHYVEPQMPVGDENDPQFQHALQAYWNEMYAVFDSYLERMVTLPRPDQYLMSYLYRIALDKGVLAYHTNSIPRTELDRLKTVADEYFGRSESLNGKVTYKYSMYYDPSYSFYQTEDEKREAVRREAVKKIKTGCPVLVSAHLFDDEGHQGGGHTVVAYEYDEQNDVIYGHAGWKTPNSTRVNLNEFFYNYSGYAYIEVSDSLRYSQNNKKFESNGTSYDTLSLSSHVHGFKGGISYANDSMHVVQCPCGETKYAFHTYKRISAKFVRCTICGHLKEDFDPDWRPGPYGF